MINTQSPGSGPGPHKPGTVVRTYNPSTQMVKARDSEVQGHPQFKAGMGYIRPCQENQTTTKEVIYYLQLIIRDQILREGK